MMKILNAFKNALWMVVLLTSATFSLSSQGDVGGSPLGKLLNSVPNSMLKSGPTDDAMKKVAIGLVASSILKPKEFKEEKVSEDEISETYLLTFKFEVLGEVKAVKRVSKTQTSRRKPAIFLLTSATSGFEAAKTMPPAPNSMVVALDYLVPEDVKGVRERALYTVTQIPKIQGAAIALLFWLSKQDDVDSRRISSVNVGLGVYLAPISLRLAEMLTFSPAATVFIRGGVQVKNFVAQYFKDHPQVRPGDKVLDAIYKFLDFIDPHQHLKHLEGPFYVVQPGSDKVIPKASAEALIAALPAPKTTVTSSDEKIFEADRDAAFSGIMTDTKKWLVENSALRE